MTERRVELTKPSCARGLGENVWRFAGDFLFLGEATRRRARAQTSTRARRQISRLPTPQAIATARRFRALSRVPNRTARELRAANA
jgi:hypothetical protein